MNAPTPLQNPMVAFRRDHEFREPTASEIEDAAWDVTMSYTEGLDRWDLEAFLAEEVLPAMRKHWADPKRWCDIVTDASTAIVKSWSSEEWAIWRNA